MGRRTAEAATTRYSDLHAAAAGILLPALGFVLEIAMVASFLYWGFRQPSPWNLVLGIGVPAVVVVLWGIFMAPKGSRRLPLNVVSGVSLVLFMVAGAALLAAGATALGWVMLAVSLLWFAASRWSSLAR
ncbi:YrdB family protein [Arthrobacter dokdonensis]|uniref:YrdB family protein n=1 Tax=Arthrobacter dokdonellae TaxID=2211210 RepID=UPI000DE5875D|nr:YrdB family protein [Arthrobacter dokdonellae]